MSSFWNCHVASSEASFFVDFGSGFGAERSDDFSDDYGSLGLLVLHSCLWGYAGEFDAGEPAFQVEVYVLRHALAFFIP